jgi:thioredoxin-dependent peroxiredoxin
MSHRILVSVLATALAFPAYAALQAGAAAPDFSAQASLAGKPFAYSLKEALKKGPVVVYFYPSAFTSGCNAQAHAFAVNQEKFTAAGATIIGVSLDNIARLNDFSADPQYCGGKIPVASDASGAIAKSYELKVSPAQAGFKDSRGAEIDHGFTERTTFIVGSDGKVAATVGGIAPAANVDAALEAVQKLAAKK